MNHYIIKRGNKVVSHYEAETPEEALLAFKNDHGLRGQVERRLSTVLAEECSGEAHRNAYIDNCMRCAPLWGWHEKKVETP